MIRLTSDVSFCDVVQCRERNPCLDYWTCLPRKAWELLRRYEDTGLTPEEVKDVFSDDEVLKLAAQTLGISLAKLLELVANEKEDIGAQPVRVTRCKDCRFWQGVGDNGSCCTGAGIDDFTDADDYCSRGRKANGASCRER